MTEQELEQRVKGRLGLFDVDYPKSTTITQDDVVSAGIDALAYSLDLGGRTLIKIGAVKKKKLSDL